MAQHQNINKQNVIMAKFNDISITLKDFLLTHLHHFDTLHRHQMTGQQSDYDEMLMHPILNLFRYQTKRACHTFLGIVFI
jgi:hypothetical protein